MPRTVTWPFFFSSRRRHTRYWRDWSSDVCSSDLGLAIRRRLSLAAVIIVAPILYAMLAKNGATPTYTFLLIAFVLAGFSIQLSIDVFSVVPRLHSDISDRKSVV